MTVTRVFMCGRAPAGGVAMASCDDGQCAAVVTWQSEREYRSLAELGWRRRGSLTFCPMHSGAGPLMLQFDDGE